MLLQKKHAVFKNLISILRFFFGILVHRNTEK